jgi:non-haem Fe2+, alpha-ketoglutarate-dependent halogenase
VPALSTSTANFSLSDEELRNFQERGYAGPFTLYEIEDMKARWKKLRVELNDRSKAIYQNLTEQQGNAAIANYDRHFDIPFLAEHICRREIVDRVASVLGPNVLAWRTELFPKYPGDEGTDWHQADTFANASGTPQILWPEDDQFGGTITVWCAFTEANIENGCLQFMPGTHIRPPGAKRGVTMFYDETKRMAYNADGIHKTEKEGGVRRGFFGYDYRQLQQDPNWKPDESKAVSMVMRPGQFIMFWSTLMHAAHPHLGKTKDMRLAFATRYVPTQVKVYPDTEYVEEYGGKISLEKFGSVLVSGKNEYSYNRIATKTARGVPFATRKA